MDVLERARHAPLDIFNIFTAMVNRLGASIFIFFQPFANRPSLSLKNAEPLSQAAIYRGHLYKVK